MTSLHDDVDAASGPTAAIDVGTNTTRLLVARASGDAMTALGVGLRPGGRIRPECLDEVRLLTNRGDDGPGASVVLLGQPELTARIVRQPQVAQRVVIRYHMGVMSPEEVDAYALHRTRVAGANRRILSKRAARAVHSETSGVPRLVNLLLANALFVAAERGEDQIVEDTIRDLAEDRRMSLEASSHEPEAQTS